MSVYWTGSAQRGVFPLFYTSWIYNFTFWVHGLGVLRTRLGIVYGSFVTHGCIGSCKFSVGLEFEYTWNIIAFT